MNTVNKQAFEGLVFFMVSLAGLLFLPAWSLTYWHAWLFMAVFGSCVLAITLYLMKYDPKLLARRIHVGATAEKERMQQVIQTIASVAFIGVFLLSALDHRFGWSFVPLWATITGNMLVALGLLAVFFVFKENSFTSAIVEIDAEQKVISTGPYALVRHPMYSGALVMILGIPPALDSWWGLLMFFPFTFVLVWRLVNEEKFLLKHLPGYAEYRKKVRYRLVPFLW